MARARVQPDGRTPASADPPGSTRGRAFRRLLLDAARLLGPPLEARLVCERVMALLVPQLADACWLYLHPPEGARWRPFVSSSVPGVRRTAFAGLDLERAVAQARAARRPIVRPAAGELNPWSYAVVPLVAREAVLGALILAAELPGRHYEPRDAELREVLEMLGARLVLALDNTRLCSEIEEAHARELRTAILESQLSEARLEALRAQLNPHVLFNTLNTIAMLVRRQANSEALRGIVGLGQLLRQILDCRSTPEVPLGEELDLVGHYLAIEQLRYRDKLTVSIDVPTALLDAQVPSLLLQPLVENAVHHGLGARSTPGCVAIAGQRRSGRLCLEVRDDGPGFPEGWDPVVSAGLGLGNTRERLLRLYGDQQRLEFRRGADGGAIVSITIPFHTLPE